MRCVMTRLTRNWKKCLHFGIIINCTITNCVRTIYATFLTYVRETIGNAAAAVTQSRFCKVVAPVIQYVSYDKWVDVFGLLWNRNEEVYLTSSPY